MNLRPGGSTVKVAWVSTGGSGSGLGAVLFSGMMKACRTCGHSNPDDAEFCATCGTAVPAEAASREERKTVTILFCDMVEFTSRFDRADPEDVRETLATYHRRVRREIERFGGTVEKFIGDAVMAVFGAPVAHEDDAQRAVLAALRIPPAIEELNETNYELPLAVRIGVETGLAVVSVGSKTSEQGIAIGDVVSTASRLQSVAPIGGVLVGEWTHRLTKELFDFEPLDPVQVKGKAEPQRVWVARGVRGRFGAELQRGLPTPFVGREDELELLKHTFARSVREPSVQLVTLLGEPGVGKSRIIRELFAYTDDRPELVFWRYGRCLPYGEGVTFWALGEIVKAHAGILESDDARTANGKLSACIAGLLGEPGEAEWIGSRLAPLVGLGDSKSEGVEQMESFSAWRLFLESVASQHPLVVVIEDLHWAQAAMIDFVSHLLEWSTGYPMLILCSARPELLQRAPRWGGGMRNSVIVSLPPLSDRETRTLLESLLPADTASDVYDLIAERAEGNPLFAEEFVRMLHDRSETGTVGSGDILMRSGSTPENLEALIAARLDTLSIEEKSLLQDASVIGRVFWPTAVAAVSGSDPDHVKVGLRDLVLRELVRPSRISSVHGDTEYAFSHAMVRDVAYGQIPRLARVAKHVVAAGWIERLTVERVADHAELLAHHYGQALELSRSAGRDDLGELEEATRRALMLAGERAIALDVARSTECFDGVLALLPADHPDRAGALFWKAEAAKDAGSYEEAEGLYRESLSAFRAGGDRVGEGESLTKLGNVLWERGAFDESLECLTTSARILESEPPSVELATCYAFTAVARILVGSFDQAIELCGRALELGETFDAGSLVSRALSFRGIARCFSGDQNGLEDFSRALAVAEGKGSSRESALALLVRAEVEWATQGPALALETVRAGRDLAERRGVSDMVFFLDALSLGALFDLGAWDELLQTAGDLVENASKGGGQYVPALAEPWITQVLLWRDRHAEASETAAVLRERATHIREAQVLVPAWVATALVAIHQDRKQDAIDIVEEIDRESEVSLTWYRENFLADIVRICVASDALPLARRLMERSRPTARRHHLSVLSASAVAAEASGDLKEATRHYEEAVEGWHDYGHQVETGLALLGAGRCLERLGDARSGDLRARAKQIFDGLGADPFVPLIEGWPN
jgi:class 3 adenylate cyclase/predicted ATPase